MTQKAGDARSGPKHVVQVRLKLCEDSAHVEEKGGHGNKHAYYSVVLQPRIDGDP